MKLRPLICIVLLTVVLAACKRTANKQAPLITTIALESNGNLGINAGGRVYETGDAEITECGLCWSQSFDPTINDNHVVANLNGPSFTQTVSNLEPFTNYYVRAYATNKYGTTYGTSEQANSGAPPPPPSVRTDALVKMSTNTFTLSGTVTSNVKQISEAGVCWNTTGIPTVNDNKSSSSTFSSTSFTCSAQGVPANTIVFARAYVSNTSGTSYGGQIVFKTYYGTMTDHEGNEYFTALINGKEWMAENLRCSTFNNGEKIPVLAGSQAWKTGSLSPACCLLSSAPGKTAEDGLFYNSAVVALPNLIAPPGWHLPLTVEFSLLQSNNSAFNFIRQSPGIWSDSYYPTNLTAFDAILTGKRDPNGNLVNSGVQSYFATSDKDYFSFGRLYGQSIAGYSPIKTGEGYCIRLKKN